MSNMGTPIVRSVDTLRKSEHYNRLVAVVVAIALVIIGSIFLHLTHAATEVDSLEAESGSKTGNATVVADSSASGGKLLMFNAPADGGGTGGGGGGGGGGGTGGGTVSADNPCPGNPAPTQWKHVVVLIFENKKYGGVIGSASAPYITSLANKCGSYNDWHDADYKVNGTKDGGYPSKPNYATYSSGLSPSEHGLTTDDFSTSTNKDNIFYEAHQHGKSMHVYVDGTAHACQSLSFGGAYHDALRFYTDTGAKSSDPSTLCNQNDLNISQFMTDVNSGNLPAYSWIIPTNNENMHNNSISSGDTWAKNFLTPFFNSAQYKSGDTAFFFLWDEDYPIPNVLVAPSIKPGSHPAKPSGNPISHFSALRTWEDMLGLPYIGHSGDAPSLINYYNGK